MANELTRVRHYVSTQKTPGKLSLRVCRELRDITPQGWRDVAEIIRDTEPEELDTEGDGVRFIHEACIDQVMRDEMESDEYVLGCFDAHYLADWTDLPVEMIQACQKADKYDAVGKAIIDGGHLETVQQGYAAAYGYGYHFGPYDFEQREITLADGSILYAFGVDRAL